MESQFPQLPVELLCLGLAEHGPLLGEQIDVERRVGELSGRQALQPLLYLRFQLNRAPGHSSDAIPNRTRDRKLPTITLSANVGAVGGGDRA
jgi:hypothetical protein